MQNYYEEKFNVIKNLKQGKKCVDLVLLLEQMQYNFDYNNAVLLCSNIIMEHKKEFEKINKLFEFPKFKYGKIPEIYEQMEKLMTI